MEDPIINIYILNKQEQQTMYYSNSNKPGDGKHQIYFSRRDFKQLFEECQYGKYKKDADPYTQLLCAKAYFLEKQYETVIKLLQKIQHDYSTKILYERQALLFKAHYLHNRKDISILQKIVTQYEHYRNRCPGRKLTSFHDTMIKNLHKLAQKNHNKIEQKVSKQEVKKQCKEFSKKRKFEGMKSYIVEKTWNEDWVNFISKDQEYPGPISNFSLINHLFEFQPPREKRKAYMETLMFPLLQDIHYVVLRKDHWDLIQNLYGGNPIQRLFVYDDKEGQVSGGDNLAKFLLKFKQQEYVMQEQKGSYWELAVFPKLHKVFDYGQLKEQTQNPGQYIIIQQGCVYSPSTRLKYTQIDQKLIRAETDQQRRKKAKLIMKYDMQKHDPRNSTNGLVGLGNLGNTCYMNASLQCLSNNKKLRDYFVKSFYLSNMNISQTNKTGSYGSVTCALGQVIKRLWFSSEKTRYIDPRVFKKAFETRFQQFRGQQQEDANEFLYFLLNCLHDDLNTANNPMGYSMRESKIALNYESSRNQAISSHQKHNKSIINDMFMGHMFEEIECQTCSRKIFRFQLFLMLQIQVPQDEPAVKFFLIVGEKYDEQALNLALYTNGIQTIEDAIKAIKNKRQKQKQMNYYVTLVQRKTYQIKKVFDTDFKFKKLSKEKKEDYYIFVYELPELKQDEEFYCFEYVCSGNPKGFPRILPLPKKIWRNQQEKKQQKLQNLKKQAAQTLCLPMSQERIQRIQSVSVQSSSIDIFQNIVEVELKDKAQRFFNCGAVQMFGQQNSSSHDRTLQACLQHSQSQELIPEQVGVFCEGCHAITSAIKKTNIYSVGDTIAIVLKRFTDVGKITTKITYPLENLDLTPYIHDKKINSKYIYKLIGVVLHRGSLNYGHYTSYCRNPVDNKWYNYDDDYVRQVSEEEVVNEAAYILFYEKN